MEHGDLPQLAESPFPFPLDPFQLRALAALERQQSVVVCAPTGSGKTVVGEYALHLARRRNVRAFYTTPLKALSNQKFRDFKAQFGEEHVGLLTGDISINRDAAVVVMTTEVFRNMLYGQEGPADLEHLQFVVLDECHYINDTGRGTVWEESVIHCPRHVQLVALSATVANPDHLAGWIESVHGPVELIVDDHRPVPLRFHYFEHSRLTPLRKKLSASGRTPQVTRAMAPHVRPWEGRTDPDEVVHLLHEKEMLPAIYFVFSRRGCEEAMGRCIGLSLVSPDERRAIEECLEEYLRDNPAVASHPDLPILTHGMAVHHAGQLPAWKLLVERLFNAGLIKAVFATETLAAGINMPARTTIISSTTKRGDKGFRSLTASEFLQMSGRAGRRGMDAVGHVVVLADPFRPAAEAAALAQAPPDPVVSRFTPTYSTVLNLLRAHTLPECEELLRLSFAQYLEDLFRPARPRSRRDRRAREEERVSIHWLRFQNLMAVLMEYEQVENAKPTPDGELTAHFRAQNELLVSLALLRGLADRLDPPALAGLCTALVNEPPRPGTKVHARPKHSLRMALRRADDLSRHLRHVQQMHHVEQPIFTAGMLAGVTEMWAEGADWEEVLGATEQDEGDIVGFVRTTIDLLRQITNAPTIGPKLRAAAGEALGLLDRSPVSDVL